MGAKLCVISSPLLQWTCTDEIFMEDRESQSSFLIAMRRSDDRDARGKREPIIV